MTDKELRKLAKYIVEELTTPDEDGIEQLGYHLTFFTNDQMEEYEGLLLKNQIEQLQRLLDGTIAAEDYEAAAVILKKIKDIEQQLKND
jgi:hypothetical protein